MDLSPIKTKNRLDQKLDKIIIIQTWWRNIRLNKLLHIIHKNLGVNKLQEISNACNAIANQFKNLSGGGLSSGQIIDLYMSEYLKKNLSANYHDNHQGENDMRIDNYDLSFKKISGKSTLAITWSKNTTVNNNKCFSSHINFKP